MLESSVYVVRTVAVLSIVQRAWESLCIRSWESPAHQIPSKVWTQMPWLVSLPSFSTHRVCLTEVARAWNRIRDRNPLWFKSYWTCSRQAQKTVGIWFAAEPRMRRFSRGFGSHYCYTPRPKTVEFQARGLKSGGSTDYAQAGRSLVPVYQKLWRWKPFSTFEMAITFFGTSPQPSGRSLSRYLLTASASRCPHGLWKVNLHSGWRSCSGIYKFRKPETEIQT